MKSICVENIGYMPIPKVACTSIKKTFYKIKNKKDFSRDVEKKDVHQYWGENRQDLFISEFKFMVVRDPIKRFLSAYSNRVCHHQELSKESIAKSNLNLLNSINVYSPGIGQFIDDFNIYNQVNSIRHHCLPVFDWIDGNIEVFDKVYKLEEIKNLEQDLSKRLNFNIKFSREQTGGRKIPIQDLSLNQVEYLIEYYRNDYDLLKSMYSLDDFWKEWKSGV